MVIFISPLTSTQSKLSLAASTAPHPLADARCVWRGFIIPSRKAIPGAPNSPK